MTSLFTSQTPVNGNAADGSSSYSMGTYFTPAVNGVVSAIRWYFPTSAQPGGAAVKANLFRNSDQAKLGGADASFANPGTPGAWNQVALTTPVAVVAGTLYCAAIRTPNRYVNTTPFAWPISNGDLSTSTLAGRFVDGASGNVDFPTTNFNSGCYFVDVVFTADGEDVETTGTAALVVTATGASTTARITAGTAAGVAAASGAATTARITTGAASALVAASGASSGVRSTAGTGALEVTSRATQSTARVTAGTAALLATAGAYVPLSAAAPMIETQTAPLRVGTSTVQFARRIVTTTTMAR